MSDLRKAAEMALEALEIATTYLPVKTATLNEVEKAMQALRQALAQSEKETLTLDRGCWERGCVAYDERDGDGKLIYKTTPQDVVWSEIDDPNKWEVLEPYGYFHYDMRLDAWVQNREDTKGVAFYTAPLKKGWVGLTKEEMLELFEKYSDRPFSLMLATHDKAKEKNSGS